jgi:hypothetical protein
MEVEDRKGCGCDGGGKDGAAAFVLKLLRFSISVTDLVEDVFRESFDWGGVEERLSVAWKQYGSLAKELEWLALGGLYTVECVAVKGQLRALEEEWREFGRRGVVC